MNKIVQSLESSIQELIALTGMVPFKSELYNIEQLRVLGQEEAQSFKVSEAKLKINLLENLSQNGEILDQVHNLLQNAIESQKDLSPGGIWVVDNYYLLVEQIQSLKQDLSNKYLQELPLLAINRYEGIPRIYKIILDLLAHTDSKVDLMNIESIIKGFQEHTYLTLGELWAIPLLLRLALIENIKRIIVHIARSRIEYDKANDWVDQLKSIGKEDPRKIIINLAALTENGSALSSAFVFEVARQIKNLDMDLIKSWLDFYLSGQGTNIQDMEYEETQRQAENRISIGNCVNSLRFINSTNWKEFIERLSIVDQLLRSSPNDVYKNMDFTTRDYYRHVVEKISKKHRIPEKTVTEIVLQRASSAWEKYGSQDRRAHTGYYLIDEGDKELHGTLHAKKPFSERSKNWAIKHAFFIFILSTLAIAVSGIFLLYHIAPFNNTTFSMNLPFIFLVVFCVFYASVEITNFLTTTLIKPKLIPKMDFKEGIPDNARTLVIYAMLLFSEDEIRQQMKQLESIYLSNIDRNIFFGFLTDWVDSDKETNPRDLALLSFATKEIEQLNQKYKSPRGDIFYLFHRKRTYNKLEKKWMGWERKRGGILDLFNALLNDNKFDRFHTIIGQKLHLKKIKYVIMLDMDTFLPFNAAKRLVAAMEHPLNQPVLDKNSKKVVKGYCILQPQVLVNYSSLNQSKYVQILGGDTGIDPYSSLTSGVYQDVFNEGSFVGKGIYNIQSFIDAVQQRFPENLLLSHDLIESGFARSGTVTDVRIFEDAPSNYLNDVHRIHRWIRGDWQIASWLNRNVQNEKGERIPNTISLLSKWKIFDNLRRSLVPFAFYALIYFGWFFSDNPLFWTLTALMLIIISPLIGFIKDLFSYPRNASYSIYIRHLGENFWRFLSLFAIKILTLPFETYINLDAIVRCLWRMKVSHKRLLEWKTFHETQVNGTSTIRYFYRTMNFSPLISSITLAYMILIYPLPLMVAGWFLALWCLSPAIMYFLSRPFPTKTFNFSDKEQLFLRGIARRTWFYFERFVNLETNWLPPDNYQENPTPRIAKRTSPTNIGLFLLTNLTAHNFGYTSLENFLTRIRKSFETLEKLQRYRGHFYNWYDLDRLEPLHPFYISTVDSGNFVGSLFTLQVGLSKIQDDQVNLTQIVNGLRDHVDLLKSCLGTLNPTDKIERKSEFFKSLQDLTNMLEGRSSSSFTLKKILEFLEDFDLKVNILNQFKNSPYVKDCIPEFNQIMQDFQDIITEYKTLFSWLKPYQKILKSISEFKSNKITKNDVNETKIDFGFTDKVEFLLTNCTFKKILQNKIDLFQCLSSLREVQKESLTPQLFNELNTIIETFQADFSEACNKISTCLNEADTLIQSCNEFTAVEYPFLIRRDSNLFSIGYNVEQHQLDKGSYDLLASEARLTSFIAIALGIIDIDHWFALSRQLIVKRGKVALVSWGGTMFEYFLPLLLMPSYKNTLLDQTYKSVVEIQIQWGKEHNIYWGASESGYNLTDALGNYQYQAFGVPGLGIKRGIENDIVTAPYATALAMLIEPRKALENLQKLQTEGIFGKYGFYEAIDYTRSRIPPNQSYQIINQFMTHHQGMIFLALGNVLLNRSLQELFEEEPHFNSALLLLQEKIPAFIHRMAPRYGLEKSSEIKREGPAYRIYDTANSPVPECQLLSNGEYHVMINNAGAGYSQYQNINLTRWREDMCQDRWGFFCYVKDLKDNTINSIGYQPLLKESDRYQVVFSPSSAEFFNNFGNLSTHLLIAVSPEQNLELRRLSITNNSRISRRIKLFSYVEVALSTREQDRAHPAFNKLFIETNIVPEHHLIIANRRPRSDIDKSPRIFHMMQVHGQEPSVFSYETDREKFIGRNSNLNAPNAVMGKKDLSNSEGYVLDPILSICPTIQLAPDAQVVIDLILGVVNDIQEAITIAENYKYRHISDRIFDLAWTAEQQFLRKLDLTENQTQLFQQLASSLIYLSPLRRSPASIILKNTKAQDTLWALNISGDLPILLVFIQEFKGIEFLTEIIKGCRYLRAKGLQFDLVIINKDYGSYRRDLHEQIFKLIESESREKPPIQKGRSYALMWEQLSEEHKILLQSVARVVLNSENGTLEEQVELYRILEVMPRKLGEIVPFSTKPNPNAIVPEHTLSSFNGYGGFTQDGKEYISFIITGRPTPRPWSNLLSNPQFGSIITECGGGYTWDQNAHEYRLTPWFNDPITDVAGEAYYIRDDDTLKAWSLTPLPRGGGNYYDCHHGFGYSKFDYSEDGIETEMWVYVDLHAPIKYVLVKVKNHLEKERSLALFGYVEWVLGEHRSNFSATITSRLDLETGAIYAANPLNREFPNKVPFFATQRRDRSFTTDRIEFIGRNRTLQSPSALERVRLSNRAGASYDPCAALHIPLKLNPNEEQQILFVLGCGTSEAHAKQLSQHYNSLDTARHALEEIWEFWKRRLGVIYLETPDWELNIITNYWLIYQVISCRLWGRTSFYQSGGAFGFRDQLQDTMALLHTDPQTMREHIINCASRQFLEGDVQHWWHPPVGRGVRTTISDDYLWLPFVTLYYLEHKRDFTILDEKIPFLEGRQLAPNEESYFDLPVKSVTSGNLYEHCKRAISYGLKFGKHGLPLMGGGDWNDGMNLVGKDGGESVWLAFFMIKILTDFVKIAQLRGDTDFVTTCQDQCEKLRKNIETSAWDGEWYLRAFFQDGTPLGSRNNQECQIDSIPQSWAVLSEGGPQEHLNSAIEAVNKSLIKKDPKMILLFAPPFNSSNLNPGYIKGYPPGIRENGGQYTHAAIWVAMAYAKLKNNAMVAELLPFLNPILHGNTKKSVEKYKVEPYVVSADIYSNSEYNGQGGWTWYTGSAGWLYRFVIESILGINLEGNILRFSPCLLPNWQEFKVHYRFGDTFYHLLYRQIGEKNIVKSVTVDKVSQASLGIELINDHKEHNAEIIIE